MTILRALAALAFVLPSIAAAAADYPAPKQGDWIAPSFTFHTGETISGLKLHYTTIGDPAGSPVVVLHVVLVVPLPSDLQTTDVFPLHVAEPGAHATQP